MVFYKHSAHFDGLTTIAERREKLSYEFSDYLHLGGSDDCQPILALDAAPGNPATIRNSSGDASKRSSFYLLGAALLRLQSTIIFQGQRI